MKFLGRIVSPSKRGKQENDFEATVHRRVEVTVDRERVSVLMPTQPPRSPGDADDKSKPAESVIEHEPPSNTRAGIRGSREKVNDRLQPGDASAEITARQSQP
jgi:hypothetical protein